MEIKRDIKYSQDNPKGYWFKRKIYGWGWVPVKWQGWIVVFITLFIGIAGIYFSEIDDAPEGVIISILFMIAIILSFGYWKGEKPCWQWGIK
jgi:hypothetical protein